MSLKADCFYILDVEAVCLFVVVGMPYKDKMTVSTKVDMECAKRLKERALEEGVSLGELIRRYIFEDRDVSARISEFCLKYDMKPENVLGNIEYLVGNGKLYVENGRMKWNPQALTPEYVSVDDKIDSMEISEAEKQRLRRSIADNLDTMLLNGDTGMA